MRFSPAAAAHFREVCETRDEPQLHESEACPLRCRVAINTTELAAGEHRAALQVSWTDGSQRSAVVSQDLTLILTGPGTARFIDVAARSDGTAAVAAAASLDLPTSRTTIVTNLTLSSQRELLGTSPEVPVDSAVS